jgi:hypothetical protein
MFEAINKRDILWTLETLVSINEIPSQGRLLIGVLFTRPSLSLAKNEIIPNLEYLHRRTDKNIHFFCPGFAFGSESYAKEYWNAKDYRSALDIRQRIENDRNQWMFSEKKFIECLSEFENDTCWKYSGETDLLLFQGYVSKKRTKIDYSSAIACSLNNLLRASVVESINVFLENLIRDAKPVHNYCNNHDLTRMSDKEGWKYGSRALAEWLVALLPGKAPAKRLFHAINELKIRDISKN